MDSEGYIPGLYLNAFVVIDQGIRRELIGLKQQTCGACEVVHNLMGQLHAILVPIEGGVVIQLATGKFGQGGYGC